MLLVWIQAVLVLPIIRREVMTWRVSYTRPYLKEMAAAAKKMVAETRKSALKAGHSK
jgi:hypothetical protein